jgi:Leucine-rich repeat (LRR) protein
MTVVIITANFLIFLVFWFLVFGSALVCTQNCTFGKEKCACNYIECRTYKKTLELCDPEDYKEDNCNWSNYYFYSSEFCDLASVACLEKSVENIQFPNLNSLLQKQRRYNITINYKVFPVIKNGWFNNLNITYLDISFLYANKIEENAFDGIQGLRELRVSINNLNEIKLNTLPDLEIFDASRNDLEKIDSETFSAMPKLKVLILKYNNIQFIAKNAFHFNREIMKIDLKSNYLIKLNFFSDLGRIIWIDLDENELVHVENEAFKSLKSLKVLKMRHNYIEKVDEGAFKGLTDLRKIRISSNEIRQVIKLNESLKLTYFSMNGNLVPSIHRGNFANLKSLIQLRMPLNKIAKIDNFSLELPLLMNLDLTNNFIAELGSSNVLYGLVNLRELLLTNNVLTSVLSFTFSHLRNLRTLNLDENFLTHFQNHSFFGLESLQFLSLKINLLKTLNFSVFSSLSNVSSLDLSSNKLVNIERGAFLGMNSLKVLKLSDNRLSFIKGTFFSNLTKLKELNLSNNQISSLSVSSFISLRSLSLLDLRDNNIFALDPRLFLNMVSLEKLDLQKNVIHSITNQTFMHAFNLKELDLSFNLLTVLKPGIFSPLTKLKSLNLENNLIAKIYFDCFQGLTQLMHLKLANDLKIEIIPYSDQSEQFLPRLDSLFFNSDTTYFIGQFNLTRLQIISLDLCEMDLSNSEKMFFDNINKIYIKRLEIGNMSLNSFINEFRGNLLEIDLSFNSIEFKTPNQFISQAKNLEKLWLAGVNITNFTRALELSVFEKLTLLDLSYNYLEIIDQSYFKFNYELRYLNLSHNSIRTVGLFAFFNNEKLIDFDLSYNEIEVLKNGMFAVSYLNMRNLFLNNNRLKLFEAESRLQSSFESIRIDNNNLTELPSAIYNTVKLVYELSLSGNPIGILNSSFFKLTNRFSKLYLKKCSLYSINNDTFEKVHTLILLDLSQNRLQYLNDTVFSELGNLQILDLSSNQIYFIQKELFQYLNFMTHLELRNNTIQEVEDGVFKNLFNLKTITLNMNPVVNLFKNQTFTGMNQLKHMTVSDRVNLNIGTVQSIKSQIKLRIVREVLYLKFYDSIEISFPPNYEENYIPDICYYISYLIRNQISFNLENEFYVHKFINDCKKWSTQIYNKKLENVVGSIFL